MNSLQTLFKGNQLNDIPMLSDLAPVIVFAYNRPAHLNSCLKTLEMNPLSNLTHVTVFIDGAKNQSDESKVSESFKVAQKQWKFASMTIMPRAINIGLSKSVIHGVSETLKHHETVIVLEDDLYLDENFLEFMNHGLFVYKETKNVASIHGFKHNFPFSMNQAFFLRGADCWGWATWRDRWEQVEWDGPTLLSKITNLREKLSLNFFYSTNYVKMLEAQISGKIDSWAVRWHISMFLQNRVTLYPNTSLVLNTGTDGSGTHGTSNLHEMQFHKNYVASFPTSLKPSRIGFAGMCYYNFRHRIKTLGSIVTKKIRVIKHI